MSENNLGLVVEYREGRVRLRTADFDYYLYPGDAEAFGEKIALAGRKAGEDVDQWSQIGFVQTTGRQGRR